VRLLLKLIVMLLVKLGVHRNYVNLRLPLNLLVCHRNFVTLLLPVKLWVAIKADFDVVSETKMLPKKLTVAFTMKLSVITKSDSDVTLENELLTQKLQFSMESSEKN
jgi:hypothetical protein